MGLISEDWRRQNELLHRQSKSYGSKGGEKHAKTIRRLMLEHKAESVLDYGCGKANLSYVLGDCVRNYDPAVPLFAAMPKPADIVLCSDVMEHVEADCVQDVLAHIAGLATKVAYFVIACRPAMQTLPDGRNTHCTVQPPQWWMEQLAKHFRVRRQPWHDDTELAVLGFPKEQC